MTVIVPARAALGLAATLFASSLAIEARAQDASPWQRDAHSAVRLLAGSRSVTVLWPAPVKFDDGAGGHSLGYHDQIILPLRIVAKNADKPVMLRAAINYAVCEKLCIPVEASAELPITSVASTEDSALFAALDTVPKPANVGDPNPLTIRDVKREGKSTVLVDVASPDSREVNLFAEGPTPDWGLPVPRLLEHSPPGVKRFAFDLEGLPPGTNPAGAALKLTLVGGDRSYEYNINLD
jgi:DsbC/DsbD-like thiol-disulfide interchange protein